MLQIVPRCCWWRAPSMVDPGCRNVAAAAHRGRLKAVAAAPGCPKRSRGPAFDQQTSLCHLRLGVQRGVGVRAPAQRRWHRRRKRGSCLGRRSPVRAQHRGHPGLAVARPAGQQHACVCQLLPPLLGGKQASWSLAFTGRVQRQRQQQPGPLRVKHPQAVLAGRPEASAHLAHVG